MAFGTIYHHQLVEAVPVYLIEFRQFSAGQGHEIEDVACMGLMDVTWNRSYVSCLGLCQFV